MPNILLRIAGLLERPQHQVGKNTLLGLAFQALGQTLIVTRGYLQIF